MTGENPALRRNGLRVCMTLYIAYTKKDIMARLRFSVKNSLEDAFKR